MAYKYSDLEKQAVEAIEKHKLFFIADITAYLPCSLGTFYDLKLQESDAIKSALTKVKTNLKVSMRSKWYQSENATLQMGLMKLISTDEELKKLSMTHNVGALDITTNGNSLDFREMLKGFDTDKQ